ncbi:hypothetical protein D9M71_611070 [compost metagenome]
MASGAGLWFSAGMGSCRSPKRLRLYELDGMIETVNASKTTVSVRSSYLVSLGGISGSPLVRSMRMLEGASMPSLV